MKTQFIQLAAGLLAMSVAGITFAQTDKDVYNNDGINKIKVPPKEVPVIPVKPDFVLTAKLPVVPESLAIFNVVTVNPANIDPAVTAAGRAFGFKSAVKKQHVNSKKSVSVLHTDANNRTLELFDSGAVFIKNETLLDEASPDLLATLKLDRESAKKYFAEKSRSFLSETKLAGTGVTLRDVTFADLTAQSLRGGVETTKVIAAAANYAITLNGIPAWGPGAATRVYFDTKGVSGFYNAAPGLKQGEAVRVIKPEAAVEKYIAAGAPSTNIRLHTGSVYKVDIRKVELVYFIDASNSAQKTVTPQYLLSGQFYGRDLSGEKTDVTSDFSWLVPAI